MVRLEPKTGQPYIFANFFLCFFLQNPYLGPSGAAHGPSGAFRWAIWASSMWACATWASPVWACATWASPVLGVMWAVGGRAERAERKTT